MRQIKFRAWDGEEMLNDWMVFRESTNTIIPHTLARKAVVVMQFTGLLDKNGKEIYEGDIVKGVIKRPQLLTWDTDENCNTNMGGIVYYDYSSFALKVIENLCEEERDGMCNYFYFDSIDDGDFDEMEIIGNIYENPELLK